MRQETRSRPWIYVLPFEKPAFPKLAKDFIGIYGTRKLMTFHKIPPLVRLIMSTSFHSVSLRYILISSNLLAGLTTSLSPSGLSIKPSYVFLFPIHATCPPPPFYSSRFDYSNSIRRAVQILKLLLMRFSLSRVTSSYSASHSRTPFFPESQSQVFTPL